MLDLYNKLYRLVLLFSNRFFQINGFSANEFPTSSVDQRNCIAVQYFFRNLLPRHSPFQRHPTEIITSKNSRVLHHPHQEKEPSLKPKYWLSFFKKFIYFFINWVCKSALQRNAWKGQNGPCSLPLFGPQTLLTLSIMPFLFNETFGYRWAVWGVYNIVRKGIFTQVGIQNLKPAPFQRNLFCLPSLGLIHLKYRLNLPRCEISHPLNFPILPKKLCFERN